MQTFSAFDPILIRNNEYDYWTADFYDRPHINNEEHWTITGSIIADKNILPYDEETKHLHGTVGEFVKWKPKKGEPILVRDNDNESWTLRIFLRIHSDCFVCTHEFGTNVSSHVWAQAKPYINPYKE